MPNLFLVIRCAVPNKWNFLINHQNLFARNYLVNSPYAVQSRRDDMALMSYDTPSGLNVLRSKIVTAQA